MPKKTFYITTTLPYVNAEPHVGFATELIRADVIARVKKLQGYEVFFNTGTDEHGQKLFDAAQKEEKEVQTYVDEYAETFRGLKEVLGISDDVHFIRTTDASHIVAAQSFWKICDANGFIYKKAYQSKYCVGCELEKTDSELVDGECPIHPGKPVQFVDEENYFFKMSQFGDKLLALYAKNPNFVVPDFRFNEIKAFVERGLQDFSISRLKTKMSWGIPVPGDEDHVMYVWFDALVNYISTLGWNGETVDGENKIKEDSNFNKFWVDGAPVQYCGKDNLRQQTATWQAMLMAAGLPNTKQVVVEGFLTGEGGIKMSKSIGNVVNPYDVVTEYGTDALRYFCVAEIASFEDSPFTMERFKDMYNAKLANGIGNLTNRVMKMAETYLVEEGDQAVIPEQSLNAEYFELYDSYDLVKVSAHIWKHVEEANLIIQNEQPFKLVKTDETKGKEIIKDLVVRLYTIAEMLAPIISITSEKIKAAVKANKMPEEALFLRRD
ncbi:MAG: methionine--tRNA ligase [Candidatus Pacebacteria bacterium]|nr:methionine--tRNA ligase [Candidatus Paceibacterota bacterium]MBP9818482.1 methionine--tRNA ligase [Candidatus Paceibacterota bacterium]